jgi:hypothetical protein
VTGSSSSSTKVYPGFIVEKAGLGVSNLLRIILHIKLLKTDSANALVQVKKDIAEDIDLRIDLKASSLSTIKEEILIHFNKSVPLFFIKKNMSLSLCYLEKSTRRDFHAP